MQQIVELWDSLSQKAVMLINLDGCRRGLDKSMEEEIFNGYAVPIELEAEMLLYTSCWKAQEERPSAQIPLACFPQTSGHCENWMLG